MDLTIRPAKPGDICVLLEPSAKEEISLLHRYQLSLQSQFGGKLIHPVHLTCQRLELPKESRLAELVERIEQVAASSQPFPLMALATTPLFSSFRGFNILKWQIELTGNLRTFIFAVTEALHASGAIPLYRPGWVPTLITALEDIEASEVDRRLHDSLFPYPLFNACRVEISRIKGPTDFETLAEVHFPQLRIPNMSSKLAEIQSTF
ncbi:MAG: hypothetical protein HY326_09535 [Chloroflexi bacterium]|nr:hypothetical protein [Chloroflexota bacterium]